MQCSGRLGLRVWSQTMMKTKKALINQWLLAKEARPFKQGVRGSNPRWSTIKDCTFVYHDKSAVFSCFRTKSTQNGKKQAKRGFGAVNTAAARPFFHLHGR